MAEIKVKAKEIKSTDESRYKAEVQQLKAEIGNILDFFKMQNVSKLAINKELDSFNVKLKKKNEEVFEKMKNYIINELGISCYINLSQFMLHRPR